MTVTVATIRGMNPHAFDDTAGELRKAATKLRTECETYQSRVEHPLAAGHGWRGGGQPDAEVVATVNALAFGTSSMRLRASGNVLTGLFHAMTKAQRRLTDAEREADRAGLSLDDDGVVREPATSAVPTGPRGGRAVTPVSGDVDRVQRRVDGIVLFATAADILAKKQLASYTKPLVTTQTADRGLLKQARDDNAAAAADLLGSITVEDLLTRAEPRDVPPGHTLETLRQYFLAYTPAALDALAIFAGTWIEATAAADLAFGRWAKPVAGDGPVAALAVGGALAIGAADLYLGNRISKWGGDRLRDDLAIARAETKGTESSSNEPPWDDLRKAARRRSSTEPPSQPVGKLSFPNDKWWKTKGIDPHEVKDMFGNKVSLYDLGKDKDGNVWVVRKGMPESAEWRGTIDDLGNG